MCAKLVDTTKQSLKIQEEMCSIAPSPKYNHYLIGLILVIKRTFSRAETPRKLAPKACSRAKLNTSF